MRRSYRGVAASLGLAGFFFLTALLVASLTGAPDRTPESPEPPPPSDALPPPASEHRETTGSHSMHRVIDGAIQPGQSLAQVLSAHGISGRITHQVAQALRPHLNLRKIRPGATFEATLDETGALTHFLYRASPLEIYEVTREQAEYRVTQHEVPIEQRVEEIAGTVTSSLFESMEALGEKPELAVRFVDIFVWDFDFNSDSQPGDRFRMLVEKTYSGAAFVRYGKILIAEYENRGKVYTGVYFETASGTGDFYTPDGRSVRKTFLRSPLQFTRISSGYTHRRRHPILGGVRPHHGIDYAAPHGTPVWAVADGVVQSAGWNGGNGKSVVIQHRGGYRTMYNHLSRIPPGIRKGAGVRQKQVIGYVGSTGLSTGPHLDYRLTKDGHFVNPLTQKFIPGDPIPQPHQAAFRNLRDRLLHQLRSSAST